MHTLGLLCSVVLLSGSAFAADTLNAQVRATSGETALIAIGKKPKQLLNQGGLVPAGHPLETGANGTVTLVWDTPSHTRIGLLIRPNSRVKLGAGGGNSAPEAILEKGQMLVVAVPPPHPSTDDRPKFLVRNRSVAMGIRGTALYTKNNGPAGPVYVCPCHGKIQVGAKTFETSKHETPTLIDRHGKMSSAENIAPEHTDEEIEALTSEARRD